MHLSSSMLRVSLAGTLGVLLCSGLGAQIVGGDWIDFHQVNSLETDSRFGFAVAGIGDINGDGFADYLVGAPEADPNGKTNAGSAFVYSGFDNSELCRVDGANPKSKLGYSVAGLDDVDGDGYADFAIGAPFADPAGVSNAGQVLVISGQSCTLLYKIPFDEPESNFGFSIDGMPDVDGDGFGDLVVGAPLTEPGGRVAAGSALVYSGVNGSLIHRVDSIVANWWFGSAVSNAGDTNGDGVADFIVGATFADVINGHDNAGAALIFSGADASKLLSIPGQNPTDMLGNAVDCVGDLNGNGFDDVIVGIYLAEPNGRTGAGGAYVVDGQSGALLFRVIGETKWEKLGWSVAGVGDVNGDGIPDFAAGAPTADLNGNVHAGKAYLYSGANGKLLHRFEGEGQEFRLGQAVAGLDDLDGDGCAEFLVSAHRADYAGAGESGTVWVKQHLRYLYTDVSSVSSGAGGTVNFHVDFTAAEAGLDYTLLCSAAGTGPTWLYGIQVPLSPDPLYHQLLNGNPPSGLTGCYGTLDSMGKGLATLVNPPGGMWKFIGREIYASALAHPSGGAPIKCSVAVSVLVEP
ncbi:MAG: hypothetical protein DWQ01_05500 [Planctomycetota bacterium]|nr:MAG: hypothetical protein DWQ01_05500 [Planctomycetota bacterium]